MSASYAGTVVYDGNEIYPFKGRTKEDVKAKFLEVKEKRGSYSNSYNGTWYETPSSIEYPYEAGVLTQDTHNVMSAMTDFYRWLVGVKPMTSVSSHSPELQAGALVRNFDFNHAVSDSYKPASMDQSLWYYGSNCQHNILASGSTPSNSITQWLNEGYIMRTGEWDYGGNRAWVGHRMALLSGYSSTVQFGYSGSVAIGDITGHEKSFEGAFTAYPAPGWMPRRKINPSDSAWSVQLNKSIITAPKIDNITVTVTELSSGASYTCNADNGKLGPCNDTLIIFAQPSSIDIDGYYSGEFRVDIAGLKDTTTGNDAEIMYTVKFMELPPEVITSGTSYSPASVGNQVSYVIYVDGKRPIKYEIIEGTLPEGVSVSQQSQAAYWMLDCKPLHEGDYMFTVRFYNDDGYDDALLMLNVINEKPVITTASLDIPLSVDVAISTQYIRADGSKPITWSIESGSLPDGLELDSTGRLTGIPLAEGTFTFTVRAENTAGTDSRTYTLNTVRVKPSITTESRERSLEVNGNHLLDMQLWATGSKPITWSLIDGNLPDGITLSADGRLSGMAMKFGTFTFTVKAENDVGYDTRVFTFIGEAVKPSMPNFTLRDATERVSYQQYLYANGTKPMTWSVVSGDFPKGLTVSYDSETEAGVISGIPEEAGSFTFMLSASNSAGSDTRVLTLTVRVNPNTPSTPDTPSVPDTPGNNTNDPQADRIRALMGRDNATPFTEITVQTISGSYDDNIAAVLGDIEIPSTGIYLIQNIALRFRIPAGSYLTWHNSSGSFSPSFSWAANSDCIFLDDYRNEITMPTASELYHVSAAIYLEGGRTYSPFITAEYPYEYRYDDPYYEPYPKNEEPPRENSDSSGGGGCNSITILAAILTLPLIRRR